MRENKYRGKSIDTGEWIYGSLLDISGHTYIYNGMYFPSEVNFEYDFIPVIPETVGQYTGLKDKKDKEIYEKDILLAQWNQEDKDLLGNEVTKDMNCIVTWIPEYCGFMLQEYNNDDMIEYSYSCISSFIVEIIGNCFDDAHLLEE